MIYHITNKSDWAAAEAAGFYQAPSFAKEGFIHCSTCSRVAGVIERYYKGQSELLLLHIDERLLTSPLKYEHAPSVNEDFPHIYGPINLDSVVGTELLATT